MTKRLIVIALACCYPFLNANAESIDSNWQGTENEHHGNTPNGGVTTTSTYSGTWWDSTKSGNGIEIDQQGNSLFVTWYTYSASGAPMWLLMNGTLDSTGTILTGPIYSYTGTQLGSEDNRSPATGTSVGTGTLTFASATSGTFSYTAYGISGSLNLTRFSFGSVNLSGTYLGGSVVSTSTCGAASYQASYAVTQTGNNLSIAENSANNVCTMNAALQQMGDHYQYQGTVSCTNGNGGTISGYVSRTDHSLTANGNINYTQGATCQITGVFGGIR